MTGAAGRAVPFHCPYCGDENLWPHEGHGAWECRSCLRAFSVKLLGLVRPTGVGSSGGSSGGGPT